jgi:hypothetical protein
MNVKELAAASDHEQTASRGAWILTYPTGVKFYPLDPRQEEIHIEDIAHALSLICRYGGHCSTFYSVAEHSVRASNAIAGLLTRTGGRLPLDMSLEQLRVLEFEALMHDAAEAYPPGDLLRPVKKLPEVAALLAVQDRIDAVLRLKFGLAVKEPPEVKAIDNVLLATESRDLRTPLPSDDVLLRPDAPMRLPARIDPWPPAEAEQRFLARFGELSERTAT